MTDSSADVPGPHRRVVMKAVETIQKRFRENLSVEELARAAGYGRAYFAGMFKKVTGKAPSEYIIELRFKEAERLLRETQLSLPVICNQVGYETTSSFHVRFREIYGCTPKELRERSRG